MQHDSTPDWMQNEDDVFIDIHDELRSFSEVLSFFKRVEAEFDVVKYCNGSNSGGRWIYQIYSQEFIEDLSGLLNRITNSTDANGPILEVMSGDGKLSEFLRSRLNNDIVTTDSKTSRDNIGFPKWVEKLDAIDAITRYSPRTVLMSWESFYSGISNEIVEKGIPTVWIGDPSRSSVDTGLEDKEHLTIQSDYLLGRSDKFAQQEHKTVIRLFNFRDLED